MSYRSGLELEVVIPKLQHDDRVPLWIVEGDIPTPLWLATS